MATPEARAGPLRAEGTLDIPTRSSSPMLRVPFPIASNMVPFLCSPRSYVSTPLSTEIRRISHHIKFSLTDWFFFLILDIGTPIIEEIPVHLRVLLGLVQAVAVRTAGFAAVPLAALAPGVE